MNLLVSILIPAFNSEKWIRDTITRRWHRLTQNWNNYSRWRIDRQYVANCKRIWIKTCKIISQSNSGASAARNKALALAQGDYIQWLDAMIFWRRIKYQTRLGRIITVWMIAYYCLLPMEHSTTDKIRQNLKLLNSGMICHLSTGCWQSLPIMFGCICYMACKSQTIWTCWALGRNVILWRWWWIFLQSCCRK